MKTILLLIGSTGLLTGCAATPSDSCNYSQVLTVTPIAGSANHLAAAPGNQQQFTSGISETAKGSSATGCPIPTLAAAAYPVWTNPDPLDITISSANNSTNGLAVCNSATSGPVTLTATTGSGTSTLIDSVTLTCQ